MGHKIVIIPRSTFKANSNIVFNISFETLQKLLEIYQGNQKIKIKVLKTYFKNPPRLISLETVNKAIKNLILESGDRDLNPKASGTGINPKTQSC